MTKFKLSLSVVVGIVLVFAFVVAVVSMMINLRGLPADPRCYEQPSKALGLKGTSLINSSAIYVCGLRSRAAMPDVIQCYELKQGCSE